MVAVVAPYGETMTPAPGEVLSGDIGALSVAVHNGFPGVLIGLQIFASQPVMLRRYDVAARSWLTVRSGAPVLLEQGVGAAYDQEVEPGGVYLYRAVIEGVERPIYDVTVAVPPWSELSSQMTGWLKSVSAPHLSLSVVMGPPGEFTPGLHARTDSYWGARFSSAAHAGQGSTSGQFLIHGLPGEDHEAIEDLLTLGGVLLWQPRPEIRTRSRYLVVTGIKDLHYGVSPARSWTVDWAEVDRPDPTESAAVTVPGWTWDRYTQGQTWDSLGRVYGDSRGLLLAGVTERWVAGAGRAV